MRIHKTTTKRRSYPTKQSPSVRAATLSTPDQQDSLLLGATKGAIYGGGAGAATASLLVLGAMVHDGISLSHSAELISFAVKTVAPASLATGALVHSLTGAGGASPKASRNTSMALGALSGIGALGYGLYSAIHSMR